MNGRWATRSGRAHIQPPSYPSQYALPSGSPTCLHMGTEGVGGPEGEDPTVRGGGVVRSRTGGAADADGAHTHDRSAGQWLT